MEIEKVEEKRQWEYTLPDGSKVTNMKDAKIKLGVSRTRLIGMLKSGLVKRIEVTKPKSLTSYGNTTSTIKQSCIQKGS